jgi:hypothetical protein
MRGMNPWKTALIVTATSASLALGDDFKTLNGKEYKDATVTRIEPDGILLKRKSRISKVYFTELPKELQQRFNYDPQQGAVYSSAEAASHAATQNQQKSSSTRRNDCKPRQAKTSLKLAKQKRQSMPSGDWKAV